MTAVGPGGQGLPTPAELADYKEAARIMGVMPYLEAEFAKIIHQTELDVYRKMDAGTFTPNEAVMAWATKRAIERALRNLSLRAKMGSTILGQAQREEK